MKKLFTKRQKQKLFKKLYGMRKWGAGLLVVVLALAMTPKRQLRADGDSAARGVFGGAATGALIGGLAGGGKGAACPLVAASTNGVIL